MSLKNSLYKVAAKKDFDKKVLLPTSKSHANRALIIGAIRGRGFKIHQLSDSTDVKTMVLCLKKIGLDIVQTGSTLEFRNSFPDCESLTTDDILDLQTGDGGTTNRFLIALLARGKKEYRFFPSEKMSERPIYDLLKPLQTLQVKIELNASGNGHWLSVKGPASMMVTSKISIDCQKSTQFATAMQLAFSTLPLQIELTNLDASADYIKLTDEVIKQTLQHNAYTVPVDFSSLSYPSALAALNGKCLITNCHSLDIFQADSQFLKVLKKSGVNCEFSAEGLTIRGSANLKALNIEVKHFPDLFPTLVFLAAHIKDVSFFSDLEILRHKESDRLEEMLKMLTAFNVDHHYDSKNDVLRINGNDGRNYPQVAFYPPRDHRIVMACFLFMRYNNGGEIAESDCVEKSFPHFFTQLE